MEKFNAIKILEKELEDKNIFDRNLSKEHYMNSVYKFVEVYLKPNLRRKLINENLIVPKEMAEEIRENVLSDKSISEKDKQVMLKDETINGLDYEQMDKLYHNKILHWLKPEEIGFLGKAKKITNQVADKRSQFLIATFKESIE